MSALSCLLLALLALPDAPEERVKLPVVKTLDQDTVAILPVPAAESSPERGAHIGGGVGVIKWDANGAREAHLATATVGEDGRDSVRLELRGRSSGWLVPPGLTDMKYEFRIPSANEDLLATVDVKRVRDTLTVGARVTFRRHERMFTKQIGRTRLDGRLLYGEESAAIRVEIPVSKVQKLHFELDGFQNHLEQREALAPTPALNARFYGQSLGVSHTISKGKKWAEGVGTRLKLSYFHRDRSGYGDSLQLEGDLNTTTVLTQWDEWSFVARGGVNAEFTVWQRELEDPLRQPAIGGERSFRALSARQIVAPSTAVVSGGFHVIRNLAQDRKFVLGVTLDYGVAALDDFSSSWRGGAVGVELDWNILRWFGVQAYVGRAEGESVAFRISLSGLW